MSDLDRLVAQDVEIRRTPFAAIVAIVVAAGLLLGGIVVGVTAAVVSVSHTEQGLCGSFGVPCTSLSLDRVRALSDLSLPDGTEVTGAFYDHTAESTSFWASVTLPDSAKSPLVSQDYQPYGIAGLAAERRWAKRMHSLEYLGLVDGSLVRSAVSGVDRAGHRELFLSFTGGS